MKQALLLHGSPRGPGSGLTTMTVLPFGEFFHDNGESSPLILADLEVGILFILAVSSLGVYGIVLAGWSSNSKYPFLGGSVLPPR